MTSTILLVASGFASCGLTEYGIVTVEEADVAKLAYRYCGKCKAETLQRRRWKWLPLTFFWRCLICGTAWLTDDWVGDRELKEEYSCLE